MRATYAALARPIAVAFVALFLLVGAVAAGGALLNGSPAADPGSNVNLSTTSSDDPAETAEPSESPDASDDDGGLDEASEPSESPEASDDNDDAQGEDVDDDNGDDGPNHDIDDDHGGDQASAGATESPEASDDHGGDSGHDGSDDDATDDSSGPSDNSGPGGGG